MKRYLLAAVNAKYIHSNLAVYCLHAYAASKGQQTEIVEYTINQQPETVLQDLYEKQADMAAFSCYIWNIDYVTRVIRNYKKICPQVEIWLGGPEVSYRAEEILTELPEVRGVMVGEGEETYHRLVSYYEQEDNLQKIPGIVYRDESGNICVDQRIATPLDFSRLPFPYGDGCESAKDSICLDAWENRVVYYESSRGCPFSCSYCLSSLDKTVRFRDMDLVKQELQFFLNRNVPQVKLIDRTFNCNAARAVEIIRYIKEKDNGITNFHFEIAADLLTPEQIELLNSLRPGLVQLEIGVQSFNEQALSAVHRKTSLQKLKNTVKEVRDGNNVHIHLDLIAGLPEEDFASFRASFNEVYSMRPHQLQLGFLKVLYGSQMEEDAKKAGMVYQCEPPYEIFSTKWLPYSDVLRLKAIEEMVEVYYNSGQFIHSLQFLLHFYESPFDFFERLAVFYKNKGYTGYSHTRMRRYDILLEFANEDMIQTSQGTPEEKLCLERMELLKELLWYDICLREKPKTRPEYAKKHQLEKQELRECCLQFGITKETEGMCRMERFSMNPEETAKCGQRFGETCCILFSYDHRESMYGQAMVNKRNEKETISKGAGED